MNRVGVALCAVSIALILVSAHSLEWRSGRLSFGDDPFLGTLFSMKVRVGLLKIEACSPLIDTCRVRSWSQFSPKDTNPAGQMFVLASMTTWMLSIVAPLVLLIGAVSALRYGVSKIAKLAASTCGCLMLAALMAAMTWAGEGEVGVGWAFWMSLAGSGAGILGAATLIMPAESYDPRELASVMARRDPSVEERLFRPRASNPRTAPPIAHRLDIDRRADAIDATSRMLRFVAAEVLITGDGLQVRYTDDSTRVVGWSQVQSLVVRKLPPDPPFEGRILLDVVAPRGDGAIPVRFLATTRANYAALPRGAGQTSMENFRRLANLVLERNPAVTFAADFGEFLAGKAPRRFDSLTQFRGYDHRFG